jgi:DNA polymerase III subunit epsilon
MSERRLQLERPLVALDLETTGLDAVNDRVIEISCVKINPNGTREVRTRRLNPGMPISPAATAVHGITNEEVAGEPTFEQVAKTFLAFLEGCDLTGFNIEHFDLPMLTREFTRAGITFPTSPVRVLDSWRIYLAKEPRDLSSAYRFFCGKELVRAHSAEADALAAADILMAQVERYADLPTNPDGLHDFCHPMHPDWIDPDGRIVWKAGQPVLGFGKHRDRSLRSLANDNPDYLRWMAGANFSAEVVSIAQAALRGEFPTPPNGAQEQATPARSNGSPVQVTLPLAPRPS